MSGAMARYPAAASASNWCRHEYQHSGKPWQRSTVGPLPASARCIRMPFVSINRCEIVIANLRKIQSHCELQPQPKWLRRHTPSNGGPPKRHALQIYFRARTAPPAASAQGRLRVRSDKTHIEHNESAMPHRADLNEACRYFADGPEPDSCSAARMAYSITSSARARSEGGTSRPSALAVLRLITSSNLVGCWTGRSEGLSPLRILSTKYAARYQRSGKFTPYPISPPTCPKSTKPTEGSRLLAMISAILLAFATKSVSSVMATASRLALISSKIRSGVSRLSAPRMAAPPG